jgi:hypothetical protein
MTLGQILSPRFLWIARLGIVSLTLTIPALAQFTFTAFDAPSATVTDTIPIGINNNGEIAGLLGGEPGHSGFIRDAAGNFTVFSLPNLQCNNGGATFTTCPFFLTGINDLGQIVGSVSGTGASAAGFIRDRQGNITLLNGPPGTVNPGFVGLDNAGESIVITNIGTPTGLQLFLHTAAGTFDPLPAPPGIANPRFAGINNTGEVAGYGVRSDGVGVGFVLDISAKQYTFFEIPDTVNDCCGGVRGVVRVGGINDSGAIIGQTSLERTFIRSPDGSDVRIFSPVLTNETEGDTPAGINQSGTIAGRFVTGLHASQVSGYIGVPSTVTTAPSISLVNVVPGPPQQAIFSVVDSNVGLFNILTSQTNAQVGIGPFQIGQTTPVTVTATKIDQTQRAVVEIIAENMAGNVNDFDPEFVTVYGTGEPGAETLSGLPSSEHILTATNGHPGLEKLHINVNGRTIDLELKAKETRTVNLKEWMRLNSNRIALSGEGPAGSLASVVLTTDPAGRK